MSAPTILCATDLTPEGARAVDLAAAFGRALGGRVVLVHATGAALLPDSGDVPASMEVARETMEARLRERLANEAEALEKERARCESLGVAETEAVLADARPAEAIEQESRDRRASLIVLGRRSRPGGYVGPTIHHVVRHADCPVAVAAPEDGVPSLSDARWLVGVDFSRQSDLALAAAVALVRACGGEIVLTNVVFPPGGEDLPYAKRTPQQILRQEGNKELAERLGKIADATGDNVRAVQRVGLERTADELIAAAEEMSATVIVAGTHGRTGLGRLFVGSTADRLVRHARQPVLLVREPPPPVEPWFDTSAAPVAHLSANHLLVAVDFSDASRRALETARQLVGSLGVAVTVVYVHEPPTDVRRGLVGRLTRPSEPPAVDEALLSKARHQLDLLVSDLFGPDAQSVTTVVEIGRPVPRILAVADARAADLVVVGTTGRSGIEHVLLGSVAETLVRSSTVPVLTVH